MLSLKERSYYLEQSYPSSEFLPVIGLNKNTLHQWIRRKYFSPAQPGTGKALELYGDEIFYIAALACLSKLGWSPSGFVRGLEEASKQYFEAYISMEDVPYRYGIAKGNGLEVEWKLCDSLNPKTHIVTANFQKSLPFWGVLDFQDLIERIATGFKGMKEMDERQYLEQSRVRRDAALLYNPSKD